MGFKPRLWGDTDGAEFLNVDLDLVADVPLDELVRALGPVHAVQEQAHPTHWQTLEVDAVGLGMLETIERLAQLAEALPAGARAQWDQCSERTLDIGVQAARGATRTRIQLPADLLERLANLRLDVAVSCYGD